MTFTDPQTGITATANDATGSRFLSLFAQNLRDWTMRETAWKHDLRYSGVKAAHPDDGWVNRERNEVHLVYPLFNDGVNVGDVIALGDPVKHRFVKVTYIRRSFLGLTWYGFEEVQ